MGGAFGRSKGGVYTWVKAAFGARWGFVAIWLRSIQNVIWYPTVLAFAAASLTYLFVTPELASQGWYNALVILVIYWAATIFTLRGVSIQASATKWFMLAAAFAAPAPRSPAAALDHPDQGERHQQHAGSTVPTSMNDLVADAGSTRRAG